MKKNHPTGEDSVAEALLASELRYRRLFETAQDGILILDAETGMVVDINPFLIHLLGYSHDQVVGKAIWELGFLKNIIANRNQFLELQRQEYVRYEHLPLETASGERREVEFISSVYLAGTKNGIQCHIRDITERVRTKADHDRLATAAEQSAETIVITDTTGAIVYANPAFATSSGYTCAEAIGQNLRILQSGKQGKEFYRRLWATLGRGEVWRGHFINKRKDGALYEEEASISPVRDAAGRVVNYIAAKYDVTHVTQREEQLRQAQKMEAVGRLAGGVAHDFNNLLTGIMGYADLCRDEIGPDHPGRKWLDEIIVEAGRSAEITRQLLAFARKQAIAPKVLNINTAVTGILNLIRRWVGEDICLGWLPGAGLWSVRMDPSQVDQILANLCVNARDAIAGTGHITLGTENQRINADFCAVHMEAVPGDYVVLTVSDDGGGMDKETQAQIFEPFFTTKGLGKGTGLGLATVYGIVKQNNGFIHVYSEPGQGTAFRLYLPRVVAEAVALSERPLAEAPRGEGESILVVEDENPLRVLCAHFLGGLGYQVQTAETPGEALKMMQGPARDVRLLMTDIVMPGMDGQQLAQRIRALKPDIRVLFMSGYTADSIAQRGVLEQDALFLTKPFTRMDLALKVHEALRMVRTS